MKNIVENADRIAEEAHASINQMRKWGNGDVPYIVHPRAVAEKVSTMAGMTDVDIAAAKLHDVQEDVGIKKGLVDYYNKLILDQCGQEVLDLVWDLTSPSEGLEWEGKPRAEKRAADLPHLLAASDRAKRIKLVDRFDNLKDYRNAPRRYMLNKYLPESHQLVGYIGYVDEVMAKELKDRIEEAEAHFRR